MEKGIPAWLPDHPSLLPQPLPSPGHVGASDPFNISCVLGAILMDLSNQTGAKSPVSMNFLRFSFGPKLHPPASFQTNQSKNHRFILEPSGFPPVVMTRR